MNIGEYFQKGGREDQVKRPSKANAYQAWDVVGRKDPAPVLQYQAV